MLVSAAARRYGLGTVYTGLAASSVQSASGSWNSSSLTGSCWNSSSLTGSSRRHQSSLTLSRGEYGMANITLNSPKTRNALSLVVMEEMISALRDSGKDKTVRCIVLRGEGKVFSSGHNLKQLTMETGVEFHQKVFATCESLMQLVGALPVPVISVVTGLAAAAGCQLVASSDIVICTPQASFSTPGASVGLFCHTPGIPLSRRVPRSMSGYMLMTGLPISGEEALRSGLATRMVEEEEIEEELIRISSRIASQPRGVIALGKRFYKKQIDLPLGEAYTAGGQVMAANLLYKDAQEGIAAFKEKRKPQFSHTEDTVV